MEEVPSEVKMSTAETPFPTVLEEPTTPDTTVESTNPTETPFPTLPEESLISETAVAAVESTNPAETQIPTLIEKPSTPEAAAQPITDIDAPVAVEGFPHDNTTGPALAKHIIEELPSTEEHIPKAPITADTPPLVLGSPILGSVTDATEKEAHTPNQESDVVVIKKSVSLTLVSEGIQTHCQ